MIAWVYEATGVNRPAASPAGMRSRADQWDLVVEACANAGLANSGVVLTVTSANSGPTVDAFTTRMSGSTSSADGISKLASAATALARAHRAAAGIIEAAVSTMDACTVVAEAKRQQAMATNPLLLPLYYGVIVDEARTQMSGVANSAAQRITEAYAQVQVEVPDDAPSVLDAADNPDDGLVNDDIKRAWAGMTREERERVLKEMVKERARRTGQNPDDIEVRFEDPDNGQGTAAWSPQPKKSITFKGNLEDPGIIGSSAHEVQHGAQRKWVDEYNSMSPAEREAIRDGSKTDPFVKYGTNYTEVSQMQRNDGPGRYIDNPFPRYHSQTNEVDARRAGRQQGNTMSYQQFQEYQRRAGVPTN